MHDWVESLLALQELDIRLAKMDEQLRSIPEKRKEAEKQYATETDALNSAKAAYQEAELAARKYDGEINALLEKKKGFQSKSALIKNNDEYRAALLQIEMCDHAVAALEEKQLEAMMALDELKENVALREKELANGKKRAEGILDDLKTLATNCQAQQSELQAKRPELLKPFAERYPDEPYLERYQRIRAGRGNPTMPCVVPVLDESCGRCRMKVTAQLRNDTINGKLTLCPNCSAMLYCE
ncbi:MAG: zinc ribbon domain-containing protein [Lentisphaeria bacterium]